MIGLRVMLRLKVLLFCVPLIAGAVIAGGSLFPMVEQVRRAVAWILASGCGCDAATLHTRDDVSTREFHKIWTEQCEAAHDIRLRYGPQAAFDYVVAEKLLNFAEAAAHRPEPARKLPRFVALVRDLFTPEELETHIARIEHERLVQEALSAEIAEEDDPFRETPEAAAERARQFSTIKELLTAAQLGTS